MVEVADVAVLDGYVVRAADVECGAVNYGVVSGQIVPVAVDDDVACSDVKTGVRCAEI